MRGVGLHGIGHGGVRPAGGGGVSYAAETVALLAAMTTPPDATRKALIDTAIVALKAAGIWDKLDECWFLAAHAEQAALLGWKRYRDCVAVNAPTFTADQGFAGNGTTSYLNTQFVPSTDGINYTLNDASYGVYGRTNLVAPYEDIGTQISSSSARTAMRVRNTGDVLIAEINQDTLIGRVEVASVGSTGLFVVRRSASNALQAFRNGANAGNGTTTGSTLSTYPFFICGKNDGGSLLGPSTRQYAMAFVGAAMSTQQQADMFTIVESYLDAIGAGVVA